MDFFEAQDQARRRSYVLVGLFLAAVISIVIGVYLALVIATGVGLGSSFGFDPLVFGVVALGTVGLIAGGSFTRTAQLRKGGSAVAELMGAREVDPSTSDPAERRLVNVVEEMSLASGTPVPSIYVMDNEPGINAFAAGYTIHDAAVAVTRGTLEQLNREELQGVVAHEFSHILNGDMRLNIRLIGLLFGILLLAIVGRGLMRGQMVRRRRSDSKGLFLGLALVALGYLGVFFGKLIKAAVSRQREFLADAAAVEFTRNPRGIGGALRKIQASQSGSRIQDHHAEELSHLFFANGVGGALARSMATHPPLEERIRRIDPALAEDPSPAGAAGSDSTEARGTTAAGQGRATSGLAGAASLGLAGDRPQATEGLGGTVPDASGRADPGGSSGLMASVGTPTAEHVAWAGQLLRRIPNQVREAVHTPTGAQATLLALLGGQDEATTTARREAASALDSRVATALDEVIPLVRGLPPETRLPLVDLALPALHRLDASEAAGFRSGVDRVIRADGEVRAFDFALLHILWRHLPGQRDQTGRRGGTVRSLGRLRRDVGLILSALAWAGDRSEPEARSTFQAGADALDEPRGSMELSPRTGIGFSELDEALSRVERGTLEVRRRVLEACASAVLADGRADTEELEIVRAVAESLELPLPPIVLE